MTDNKLNVIEFENLKDKLLNRNITLIDVREPKELKEDGKIPNSVNIPLGQIVDAFKMSESAFQSKYGVQKPDEQSDPFVLSCRSGKRATDAFQKLSALGYNNISVYSGSFQDWVKNGGPIEK
ncbi:Rhodanese domain-containing protein CG4456 [Argiope bruennichi]|uniref:Rhodanese domain-containing protein CG4456 n=2 Tax=Argiope bruennichi TaxID=94029 RepID=A0A8T0E933_ARGBR|nr:Rhodanese domain-containing protein CG4456 [Argiope bruennichi]